MGSFPYLTITNDSELSILVHICDHTWKGDPNVEMDLFSSMFYAFRLYEIVANNFLTWLTIYTSTGNFTILFYTIWWDDTSNNVKGYQEYLAFTYQKWEWGSWPFIFHSCGFSLPFVLSLTKRIFKFRLRISFHGYYTYTFSLFIACASVDRIICLFPYWTVEFYITWLFIFDGYFHDKYLIMVCGLLFSLYIWYLSIYRS